MNVALVRARMCQLLAARLGYRSTKQFFTAGLFSGLDAFWDCSMADALEQLTLTDTIRAALLTQSGDPGRILQVVMSYERAQWISVVTATDFSKATLRDAYLQSLEWAHALIQGLGATPGSKSPDRPA